MKQLALFVAALAAACATSSALDRAEISEEVVVESTVQAVDAETREITLKREDGALIVVVAGPAVRNFPQIEVGDTVNARYRVTLSAQRLKPDETAEDPAAGVAVGVAAPGTKPGVAIASGAEVTVTVETVDKRKHIVVLTGPDGELHSVRAQRDEGRRFVEGLKAGDRVKLAYAEAVALSVDE